MTVADLIAALQALPPEQRELRVYFAIHDDMYGGEEEIGTVTVMEPSEKRVPDPARPARVLIDW